MFGPRPRGRLRPGQAQRGAGLGKDGLALADLLPHPEAWLPLTTQGAGPVACARRPHSHLPPRAAPAARREGLSCPGRAAEPAGIGLLRHCSWGAEGDPGKWGVSPARPYARLPYGPATPPPQAHVGPGEVQTRPHAGLHTRVHGSRPSVCLHMTDGQSMAQPHSGRRVPTTLRSLCRAKEASPGRRHAARPNNMKCPEQARPRGLRPRAPRGRGSHGHESLLEATKVSSVEGRRPLASGRHRAPMGWTLQVGHCLARESSQLSC